MAARARGRPPAHLKRGRGRRREPLRGAEGQVKYKL